VLRFSITKVSDGPGPADGQARRSDQRYRRSGDQQANPAAPPGAGPDSFLNDCGVDMGTSLDRARLG